MSRSIALILAMGLGLAAAAPAFGQAPTCMKRTDLVRQLAQRFQEAPIGLGLADNGGAVEVFVNPASASWTLTLTMPNGISCLLASGENWESLPVGLPGRPA